MDARRRLFALLVTVLCAVGWVPSASARAPDDRVTAPHARGLLPWRRPGFAATAPVTEGDDDAVCLPPVGAAPGTSRVRRIEPTGPVPTWVVGTARRSPASPRGPPSSR